MPSLCRGCRCQPGNIVINGVNTITEGIVDFIWWETDRSKLTLTCGTA